MVANVFGSIRLAISQLLAAWNEKRALHQYSDKQNEAYMGRVRLPNTISALTNALRVPRTRHLSVIGCH